MHTTTEDRLKELGYQVWTWINPEGKEMSMSDAQREAFGACKCCGKPNSYVGAVRCGAACTALHESHRCNCYASKQPAKTE